MSATSEICASIDRIFFGTFETTHEVTRTFDTAAWCLIRLHREMNFDDVQTCEQAETLAPPPHLVTNEEKSRQCACLRRLYHSEEESV
jgi:hypothetical protein